MILPSSLRRTRSDQLHAGALSGHAQATRRRGRAQVLAHNGGLAVAPRAPRAKVAVPGVGAINLPEGGRGATRRS